MAKDLSSQLGYPALKDLVKIVKAGLIVDCPISIQDVYRAIRIYGPDLASLRGRTKKSSPSLGVLILLIIGLTAMSRCILISCSWKECLSSYRYLLHSW